MINIRDHYIAGLTSSPSCSYKYSRLKRTRAKHAKAAKLSTIVKQETLAYCSTHSKHCILQTKSALSYNIDACHKRYISQVKYCQS